MMICFKNMNQLISIIVPCYNQAEYLPDTLQSVFDQKYRDWECIVVNDGSSDSSEEIALQWTRRDNRFKYFHKENSGVADTRNYGIKQATGDYILPLDADDLIDVNLLSEAMHVFSDKPETKLVYCNVVLFGAKKEKVKSTDYNFLNMLVENQIPCTAFIRRSDFLKTDGYNLNMADGLEDWDFWLSFLNSDDKVVKLDGYYLHYRIKNISRSALIDNEKNEKLLLQIFKNHASLYLKYFNPIRDHINADYYKKRTDKLTNSVRYKIGSVLYYPFELIEKIINKTR